MSLRQNFFKRLLKSLGSLSLLFDVLLSPLTLAATIWFRIARYWGVKNLPVAKRIFLKFGLYPIVDHYYDPLFDFRKVVSSSVPLESSLRFDHTPQLNFINTLRFSEELNAIPLSLNSETAYFYRNGSFGSGDSELYYSIIREKKPARILEVGSGFSTRIAVQAVKKNKEEISNYTCAVTCIEPYEMPWLEKLDVKLIRKKVEELSMDEFEALEENDILFIDSSHIIRPGGDVFFLILRVLPRLKKGVWIHFHDIFTPAEYPIEWLRDEFRMWNEQYLLEAFLVNNRSFETVVALNFLAKNFRNELGNALPVLAKEPERDPGSFWIRKIE
jgi:hypothetical protein